MVVSKLRDMLTISFSLSQEDKCVVCVVYECVYVIVYCVYVCMMYAVLIVYCVLCMNVCM